MRVINCYEFYCVLNPNWNPQLDLANVVRVVNIVSISRFELVWVESYKQASCQNQANRQMSESYELWNKPTIHRLRKTFIQETNSIQRNTMCELSRQPSDFCQLINLQLSMCHLKKSSAITSFGFSPFPFTLLSFKNFFIPNYYFIFKFLVNYFCRNKYAVYG